MRKLVVVVVVIIINKIKKMLKFINLWMEEFRIIFQKTIIILIMRGCKNMTIIYNKHKIKLINKINHNNNNKF